MPGVIHISEAVSIGIHAMVLIAANPGRMLSSREIASTFHISSAHLAKVMQRLVKEGLAISTRGPSGGFSLGRNSDEITLRDIYEVIEGRLEENRCLLGRDVCLGNRCILGGLIHKINREVFEALSKTTLAELTRSYLLGNRNNNLVNGINGIHNDSNCSDE